MTKELKKWADLTPAQQLEAKTMAANRRSVSGLDWLPSLLYGVEDGVVISIDDNYLSKRGDMIAIRVLLTKATHNRIEAICPVEDCRLPVVFNYTGGQWRLDTDCPHILPSFDCTSGQPYGVFRPEVDELTRSILATMREQEKYPERFTYTTICDNCGRKTTGMTSKDEIDRYKDAHNGSTELHIWTCEKCEPESADED